MYVTYVESDLRESLVEHALYSWFCRLEICQHLTVAQQRTQSGELNISSVRRKPSIGARCATSPDGSQKKWGWQKVVENLIGVTLPIVPGKARKTPLGFGSVRRAASPHLRI